MLKLRQHQSLEIPARKAFLILSAEFFKVSKGPFKMLKVLNLALTFFVPIQKKKVWKETL